MQDSVSDHWGKDEVYDRIISALESSGKLPGKLTVEDLAPVDQFHARGLPATIELADRLPVKSGDLLVDIGCGIGGPARYFAHRFGCRVFGIDVTPSFVDIGNRLSALLEMEQDVVIELGDGHRLPYPDNMFDGAISQHVTMNVADRRQFFGEAWRVLKPGGFFTLSEHALGPEGAPHHPLPWSADGSHEYLVSPEETRACLEDCGFADIHIEATGEKYLAGYRRALELAERGELPPLGLHILLGENSSEIVRNAARNIEERRTHPIHVICSKTG